MNVDSNCPVVEVCVGSVADAEAAEAAGADRLELCAATELGGLTPSLGLLDHVIEAVQLPVVVMIRPRTGGFCYDQQEFAIALRDAVLALDHGVAGIVFGFLHASGEIDAPKCREFVELAGERDAVFHRAFDVTPDALSASDCLVEAGVTRLLTSGQAVDAVAGADVIRAVAEHTNGKLTVMPGGGIREHNVRQVVELTGCRQIHIGASAVAADGSLAGNPEIDFCGAEYLRDGRHRIVDRSSVASVLKALTE